MINAREIKRGDKLVALGLALCAAVMATLALSAPANAGTYSNGFKLSKFKVEIKGWQKTVLQHHKQAENECDFDDFSSGSEKVTFATPKPIYLTASYMKGQQNPSFFATKQVAIPTKAVIKRSYSPRIHGPAVPCEENGGGVDTTYQPDCGTKTVNPYEVQLQYAESKKNALLLSGYYGDDPFERCSGAGGSMNFPNLLVEKNGKRGNFIYAELSQDELFDPQFQKWISIAEGTRKETYGTSWAKTTVHWEVSFTRLKEKVSAR
jgi:hypothetical protein